MDAALPQPKWLIIFNLHMERLEITNHFQRQPESSEERALLRWSETTKLPSLGTEATWPKNI